MREEGERRGQEWSVRKRWARIGSERDRDRGARERERAGERVEGECSDREG